jgi:RNA polymerase sigma-70 factor (ECF subfamily)
VGRSLLHVPGTPGLPDALDGPHAPGVQVREHAPDERAEDRLVERARLGDGSAYEALVRSYRGLAFRTAYLITGDAADAEDAVQEAFVKAHRGLADFRTGAPFRPWLLRIAANEARNRHTSNSRRAALAQRAADDAGGGGDRSIAGQAVSLSPEDEVLRRERAAALRAAVNGLRAEDRLVIAGRYFLDLSEAEMADVLGLPRGTIKSRLSRALARLRRHPLIVAVLVALLALAGVLVTSPAARTAVAGRLGLRGVQISHVPSGPAPGPAARTGAGAPPGVSGSPGAATPGAGASSAAPGASGSLAGGLGLGERDTLVEAQARVGFPVLVPASLGAPDEVYVSTQPPGGQVALVYRPRPDLADTRSGGQAGAGLLLAEFRGDLNVDRGFIAKGLGPNTTIETVAVEGGAGLWIAGRPHSFFYRDANGQVRDETVRLAGNTLLWERGPLTLRLEGAATRDDALRIATALR